MYTNTSRCFLGRKRTGECITQLTGMHVDIIGLWCMHMQPKMDLELIWAHSDMGGCDRAGDEGLHPSQAGCYQRYLQCLQGGMRFAA